MIKEIENYQSDDIVEMRDKEYMLKALKYEEDVYTRKNTKNHFCVSAWIVDESFTKVLMAYHNIYDSWSWIGGHLDGNIDSKKKILEEIEEETGVSNPVFLDEHIISLEVLEVKEHIKNGKFVEAHNHFDVVYLLQASTEEKLRVKEDENQAVAWIDMKDIKDKVKEKHMIPIYEKLVRRTMSYK